MRDFCILVCLILWLGLISACGEIGAKHSVEEVISKHAKGLLEDERFHSVSIGVLQNGNSTVRHFGELSIGQGNTPTDDHYYEIASVTKLFTGTLVAKAIADGKLNLDADIREYLPEPYPNLEKKGTPIRVRHLVTHTSGLPQNANNSESQSNYLLALAEVELEFVPGSKYAYSNMGSELTALLLQTLYQRPYAELLQAFIFTPADMQHTRLTLSDDERGLLVKGYNEEQQLMPSYQLTLWGGKGGLNATIPDLLKFAKWHLNGKEAYVKATHAVLHEISDDLSIAYHWYIEDDGEAKSLSHHGGLYGMQNWLVLYPRQNLAFSVATNTSFEQTGEILAEMIEDMLDALN